MNKAFRVGDKVRMVNTYSSLVKNPLGVATVVKVHDIGYYVSYEVSVKGMNFQCLEQELELVEAVSALERKSKRNEHINRFLFVCAAYLMWLLLVESMKYSISDALHAALLLIPSLVVLFFGCKTIYKTYKGE